MALEWIVALGGLVAAVFGYIWLVSRNCSEGDKRLHERCDGILRDLATYREQVAMQFTTRADAKEMESRLDGRLARIEEKLDRVIEGRG